MPVSVNEKTRRMRSQTDASQRCLAQFAGAHFNKGDGEWFITPGSPELTHSVQPAASSVPSEQPDSWLSKQRWSRAARLEGERKIFQPSKGRVRSPVAKRRNSKRDFFYVLLTRKSVTGEENKVVESWEISKRKQKYVQWKQTDQNKRRAPLTSEREHISGEDWRQHCQKSFYHFLKKLLIGTFFLKKWHWPGICSSCF